MYQQTLQILFKLQGIHTRSQNRYRMYWPLNSFLNCYRINEVPWSWLYPGRSKEKFWIYSFDAYFFVWVEEFLSFYFHLLLHFRLWLHFAVGYCLSDLSFCRLIWTDCKLDLFQTVFGYSFRVSLLRAKFFYQARMSKNLSSRVRLSLHIIFVWISKSARNYDVHLNLNNQSQIVYSGQSIDLTNDDLCGLQWPLAVKYGLSCGLIVVKNSGLYYFTVGHMNSIAV